MTRRIAVEDRSHTKLANGIEIVTDPARSAETLSINVSFRVGSCHEGDAPHGIAHFMEHMAFKGTARRTSDAIQAEICGAGGSLNAHTDQDTTSFICTTLREELAPSLEVLADIVTNPRLDASDVELERNVILREIDEGKGTWATMQDCFYASAYGEQDLARPIIGTEEGVGAVSSDLLHWFVNEHYTTGNMIVAVAGNVDHRDVVALVEEKFEKLPSGPRNAMPSFDYYGGEQGFACSCERGIVRLGYEAPVSGEDDYEAFVLFRNIVSWGPSSRLFKELRERRGLVYSVNGYPLFHCGSALAVFETEGEASKIKDIFLHLHQALVDAADNITAAEVAQAQRLIEAWDRMRRDDMSTRTSDAVFHLIADDELYTPAESHERFRAASLKDVRAAGKSMLASAPTLVAHGHARAMPRLSLLTSRKKAKRPMQAKSKTAQGPRKSKAA